MNDRQIYETLANLAEQLMAASEAAETLVGQTALRTAAGTIAGTAKAIYEHALGGDEH